MTVCFLGLFVSGGYHTACLYSGPVVLKFCFCYVFKDTLVWSSMGFQLVQCHPQSDGAVVQFLACLKNVCVGGVARNENNAKGSGAERDLFVVRLARIPRVC